MSDDTKALVTHGLRLSVALSSEDVRALDAFIAQLGASQSARIAELERELAEARANRDSWRQVAEAYKASAQIRRSNAAFGIVIDTAMGESDG